MDVTVVELGFVAERLLSYTDDLDGTLDVSIDLMSTRRSVPENGGEHPYDGGGDGRQGRREGVLQDHPHLRPQVPFQNVSTTRSIDHYGCLHASGFCSPICD